MACVEKVLCMLACWVEDPYGDSFKKHLARLLVYIWMAKNGIKMQTASSQQWDTSLVIQVLIACNLTDEIGATLMKGHDFIKKSQVRDNPFGDFRSMYKHISKGSWTFSDRDHGWQVSDYTTESLKPGSLHELPNGWRARFRHLLSGVRDLLPSKGLASKTVLIEFIATWFLVVSVPSF
ncbi:Germanicol synthase [Vitis vinifera]|uniref:Germanicol synthase n=1 Tax=Vitis vinifera TaxID=29760 RepID=A0A438CIY1_VITVI|nr:Germanicol synthase [Vitis vinifera]